MKFPYMRLFTMMLVLVALSIACNLPISNQALPSSVKPLSTQEVQQLKKQIQATLANPGPSGEVSLTITQDQLNGFIASQIANHPDSPITNPQVVLKDGQMEMEGTAQQSGITATTRIVVKPGLDSSSRPNLTVISISIGPIEAPDVFKTQVQALVDNTLTDYLASNAARLKVTKITVTDGSITVTGVPNG